MSSSKDSTWRALAWMSASALGFSLMSIFVKRLSKQIPEFELVFFRSVINFSWVMALATWRGQTLTALRQTPGKPLLIFRGLAGFAGVSCLFYGLGRLPLPVATLLNWCSPIFVILFSRIFLKEKLSPAVGVWGGLALIGLLLLVKPDPAQVLSITAVGVTLLGAAFGGMAYVAVRAATARASVEAIVLYFMAVSTVISAPLAAVNYREPTVMQWVEIFALGSFATWGQVTMTHAYRHAPAGVVSLMNLLNPIFGAVLGFLFFREWLTPIQGMGMMMILFAVGALAWQSGRPAKISRM